MRASKQSNAGLYLNLYHKGFSFSIDSHGLEQKHLLSEFQLRYLIQNSVKQNLGILRRRKLFNSLIDSGVFRFEITMVEYFITSSHSPQDFDTKN